MIFPTDANLFIINESCGAPCACCELFISYKPKQLKEVHRRLFSSHIEKQDDPIEFSSKILGIEIPRNVNLFIDIHTKDQCAYES